MHLSEPGGLCAVVRQSLIWPVNELRKHRELLQQIDSTVHALREGLPRPTHSRRSQRFEGATKATRELVHLSATAYDCFHPLARRHRRLLALITLASSASAAQIHTPRGRVTGAKKKDLNVVETVGLALPPRVPLLRSRHLPLLHVPTSSPLPAPACDRPSWLLASCSTSSSRSASRPASRSTGRPSRCGTSRRRSSPRTRWARAPTLTLPSTTPTPKKVRAVPLWVGVVVASSWPEVFTLVSVSPRCPFVLAHLVLCVPGNARVAPVSVRASLRSMPHTPRPPRQDRKLTLLRDLPRRQSTRMTANSSRARPLSSHDAFPLPGALVEGPPSSTWSTATMRVRELLLRAELHRCREEG